MFVLCIVGCGEPNTQITSLSIDTEGIEIEVGEDKIIPITYDGIGDYSDLNIYTSDESIAITDNNYITGVSAGITTLVVSSKNDSSLTFKYTLVIIPPFSPFNLTLTFSLPSKPYAFN